MPLSKMHKISMNYLNMQRIGHGKEKRGNLHLDGEGGVYQLGSILLCFGAML